jgi:hypothetical protein
MLYYVPLSRGRACLAKCRAGLVNPDCNASPQGTPPVPFAGIRPAFVRFARLSGMCSVGNRNSSGISGSERPNHPCIGYTINVNIRSILPPSCVIALPSRSSTPDSTALAAAVRTIHRSTITALAILWHFQSLTAPDGLHPNLAYRPTTGLQQRCDPPGFITPTGADQGR